MSLKPLDGFQPLKTHHCITGSLRHVYEFHDTPISEELLLGLGAGVGFVYWHMKGALPFLGGRANVGRPGEEGLERTAGRRTGVEVEAHQTTSARKAETGLLDLLTAGEPVMLLVDMGFLSYLRLPEGYHFGGHAVVAAGYEAAGRQTLLADRDGALHPVSLETLAKARGSQFKPFPPRNTWYTFNFSGRRAPQPHAVCEAIWEVASGMLHPPIANLGVPGIRTAAARIAKWPEALSDEEVRAACHHAALFIDARGGTGGGLFRYLYARFLQEAAPLVGQPRIAEVSGAVQEAGDAWEGVAGLFREAHAAPDPAPLLDEITGRLPGIADREQAFWRTLRALCG